MVITTKNLNSFFYNKYQKLYFLKIIKNLEII